MGNSKARRQGVLDVIREVFWSRVQKAEYCWEYISPGVKGAAARAVMNGSAPSKRINYRQFCLFGYVVLAHRAAWEITYGPIPEGKVVRHVCDNPRCVRPEHLELGTQSDNIKDAWDRGRRLPSPLRGEKNPAAKVTNAEAEAIRALYAAGTISQREIGELYGIVQSTVSLIVRKKKWATPKHGMPGSWA